MPVYIYSAKDRGGKDVRDEIMAESREAVGQMLRQQGLIPTSIREKIARRFDLANFSQIFGHVSLLEKLTFIKNLSVTLKAGLPISRALKVVTAQMPNAYFRKIVGEISVGVESGKTMSETMAQHPHVFSSIFVNMVKVGESSGELDKSLQYLATQIERDYNLIRRTKNALTYPAVVLATLLIIGYIMFTFVLPKLTSVFEEFEAELPILTKTIIALVDIFSKYSILIGVVMIALVAGFMFWRKTANGRAVLHRVILVVPILGKITKKINLARFTLIFSGLLRSGMPIVEALRISGNTMGNIYYQQALLEASEKVKIGVDLRTVLEKHSNLFTPMVTQMVRVGEESGTMESVLSEVANFYESEVDDSVKNLSSIIEPILVILIGAVVGVLAVGLILPIYNLGQVM